MKAWTAPFVALAVSFVSPNSPASPVLPTPAPTTAAPVANVVNRLKTHVPSTPNFLLRGTFPIRPRPFDRNICPFSVLDPSGNTIPAQWELVARLDQWMIVEVRARVQNLGWTGVQNFSVIEAPNAANAAGFDPGMIAMLLNPSSIQLQVRDQLGSNWTLPIAGISSRTQFHRLGSVTVTAMNGFETPLGGVQAWFGLDAGEQEIDLILNWHNGGLPAKPDIYFNSAQLVLPAGWTFTSVLPDPAVLPPYIVKADNHILPQRMERSFRLIIHRTGTSPDVDESGFAVGDWSAGGYFPQAIALPDLSHTGINLRPQKADDFNRLQNLLPTVPGEQPESFLWPAAGVYYGGMTSGHDIDTFHAVPLAASAQPEGLLSLYVEQLRYGSRHMGCIYEPQGAPIQLDGYLNPNKTKPWVIFNNRFYGNPPQDAPFFFSHTGPGVGMCSYDPLIFEPIDSQHLVRRTKGNKALVWLANDPLAKLYVLMDAEIGRMTLYEGPGGPLVIPATPALGTEMGRGEAWIGDVMAAAYAVSEDGWRQRNSLWFFTYWIALKRAQMPNNLYSAIDHGKIALEPPLGNWSQAYYFAHRSNEQVFLMMALSAFKETGGLDCSDTLRRCGLGLWEFAWKVGTTGILERYPAGPVVGPRYATRAEIPAGLTNTIASDAWYVGLALGTAQLEGANMVPAILAHTQTNDLAAAKAKFESWGLTNIANRANSLAVLQQLVP